MTIGDLYLKHQEIQDKYCGEITYVEYCDCSSDSVLLTIEFTINTLESIGQIHDESVLSQRLKNKISELKQYLDEEKMVSEQRW